MVQVLAYADDVALLARSQAELKAIFLEMEVAAKKEFGLEVKCHCLTRADEQRLRRVGKGKY
uniref:Reverse transcriptase domain-containing protein n=1 Tax=Rhodnius prolixus TaxID=13249 RepID=T1IAB4_RHOPR